MDKKRIILIEPSKYLTDRSLGAYVLGKYYSYRSLGLTSIEATLKNKGHEVILFSSGIKNWYLKFQKILLENKPDFIGISTTSYTIEQDMNLAFLSRKLCPKTPIVMGGYYAWSHPLEVLKRSESDIVIRGMGEYPFMKLVKFNLVHPLDSTKAKKIKTIPGLCIKFLDKNQKESYLTSSPFIPSEKQLNQLPLPSLEKQKGIQSIYTSLGCTFRCKFCSVPFFYQKMIYLSPKKVISWIKKISDAGYRIIYIVDPDFNLNRKRALALCSEIIKAKARGIIKKSLTFRCQARLDLIDNQLLSRMKKAGFIRLLLGIETLSPKLLKNDLDKGGTIINMGPEEINTRIRMIAKKGLNPYIYLILGLPNSTKTEIIKTLKYAQRWQRKGFAIEINVQVAPFPETRYFQEHKNSEIMVYRNCRVRKFGHSGKIRTLKFKLPYFLRCKNKEAEQMVSQIVKESVKLFLKNKRLKYDYAVIKAAKSLGYI